MPDTSQRRNLSRREFIAGAGAAGLAAAAAPVLWSDSATAATSGPDGTPEQIHLQWAVDPTS
ncbi:MAG: twin-arginine translocation signal domain-containing protein, partial [Acidimicrobiales bacterium]